MTMYKVVYKFEVLDKLRNDVEVYVLDRATRAVSRMSKLNLKEALKIIDNDDSDNRYALWEEINIEDGKNNE